MRGCRELWSEPGQPVHSDTRGDRDEPAESPTGRAASRPGDGSRRCAHDGAHSAGAIVADLAQDRAAGGRRTGCRFRAFPGPEADRDDDRAVRPRRPLNDGGSARLSRDRGLRRRTGCSALSRVRGGQPALRGRKRKRPPLSSPRSTATERRTPVVFATGLPAAHSVTWHDGACYAGVTTGVVELNDIDGDGRADAAQRAHRRLSD